MFSKNLTLNGNMSRISYTSLNDNLTLQELALVNILENLKSSNKVTFTKAYLESIASSSLIKSIRMKGYLTMHRHPSGKHNVFSWYYEISSFSPRTNDNGIISYDGKGNPKKVLRDQVWNYAKASDKFFFVPANVLLNKNLSLNAKGLFVLLYHYCQKKNTKKDMREFLNSNHHLSNRLFEKAWSDLLQNGFLSEIKKPNSNKGMEYIFLLNDEPSEIKIKQLKLKNFEDLRDTTSGKDAKTKAYNNNPSLPISLTLNNYYSFSNKYIILTNNSLVSMKEQNINTLNQLLKTLMEVNCTDTQKPLIQKFNNRLLRKFGSYRIAYYDFVIFYKSMLTSLIRNQNSILNQDKYISSLVNKFTFNEIYTILDEQYIEKAVQEAKVKIDTAHICNSNTSKADFNKWYKREFEERFDLSDLNETEKLDFDLMCNGLLNISPEDSILKKLERKNRGILNKLAEFRTLMKSEKEHVVSKNKFCDFINNDYNYYMLEKIV